MQIFGLRGPVARQREFKSAADGPAGIGGVGAGKARGRGADIADREAAGDVGHHAAKRVTGAAAHRGKPSIAGGAAIWAQRRACGPLQARPVDIAFEAEDSIAVLPILAGSTADLAA